MCEPDWLTKLLSVNWSWRSRISSLDERLQVQHRDLLLLVGDLLEAREGLLELVVRELVAELGQLRAQRVPAAVLAQHDVVVGEADVGRRHDLERGRVAEHAGLVDAALVGEGVAAHDGLVALDRVAGQRAHQAARAGDLPGVHPGLAVEVLAARADGHDDLFERGVAGALADAVDGALHLRGAGAHRGQRVGRGQPQVVVAVHAHGDVVQRRREPVQLADEVAVLQRQGVAHGVGHVDGGRAALDGDAQHLGQVLRLGAARVHGAELHVGLGAAPPARGQRDHGPRVGQHLVLGLLDLVLEVHGAGADERVDARDLGDLHGVPADADVLLHGPRQAGDARPLDLARDGLHRVEVVRARRWESPPR